MKNSQKHAVLSWEDGHLTMDAMVNYHEGKLSPGDMYKAERHLLHCELCADATEGISGKSGKSLSKPIHELKEMVKMRVSEEGERKRLPRKYLAIAASFLLLAGLTYTVILISEVQFAETHGSVAMDVQEKKTPYTEGKHQISPRINSSLKMREKASLRMKSHLKAARNQRKRYYLKTNFHRPHQQKQVLMRSQEEVLRKHQP